MSGDPAAINEFDTIVKTARPVDPIVRVKVWTETGKVVYSDEPAPDRPDVPAHRRPGRGVRREHRQGRGLEPDAARERLRAQSGPPDGGLPPAPPRQRRPRAGRDLPGGEPHRCVVEPHLARVRAGLPGHAGGARDRPAAARLLARAPDPPRAAAPRGAGAPRRPGERRRAPPDRERAARRAAPGPGRASRSSSARPPTGSPRTPRCAARCGAAPTCRARACARSARCWSTCTRRTAATRASTRPSTRSPSRCGRAASPSRSTPASSTRSTTTPRRSSTAPRRRRCATSSGTPPPPRSRSR